MSGTRRLWLVCVVAVAAGASAAKAQEEPLPEEPIDYVAATYQEVQTQRRCTCFLIGVLLASMTSFAFKV